MTADFAKVRALIERLVPEPVCDDCIAQRLELAALEPAGLRTLELAGADGFERSLEPCALCGTTKKVTRKAR